MAHGRGNRIRVCYVAPYGTALFSEDGGLSPFGGAELQMFHQALALVNNPRFEVCFIVHGPEDRPPETYRSIQVHFTPFVTGLRAKWLFQKKMMAVDGDVYVQRGFGSITREVAFFCLWRRKKFIYWIASNKELDEGLAKNRGFRWGVMRADRIVAQTLWQAERLKSKYDRESKVIANALPDVEGWDRPRKRDYLLWIGRFVPVKRPELFLEMARRMPEERFVMIGQAETKLSQGTLEKYRAEMAGIPNLEFFPGVPFEESDQYILNAKLLVNTSETEGFSNTFVQAMECGTPMASLNADPDNMILSDKLGVGATGDDLDRFVGEVSGLVKDPEKLAECGRRARDRYEEFHLPARQLALLIEVIEDAVGE